MIRKEKEKTQVVFSNVVKTFEKFRCQLNSTTSTITVTRPSQIRYKAHSASQYADKNCEVAKITYSQGNNDFNTIVRRNPCRFEDGL